MKILYIVDTLTVFGGCEMHVITLANEMAKSHDVIVLTNHLAQGLKMQLKNVKVIVGFNENNYKKIVKEKINVIHANPFTGTEIGSLLKPRLNSKLFVTMHGNYTTGLTPKIVENSEKIIFVNETAKNACKDLVPEDKGIIISNPIDINKFKSSDKIPKRIKDTIVSDYKTIVVSSRIADKKEVPMFQLAEIATKLSELMSGLNIIFVGNGDQKPELEKKFSDIESILLNVEFVGEVKDVYNYLNIADLVLACDRCAIEALLCEKIVFYMGLGQWKSFIGNENFEQLLFTNEGYTDYTNSEILTHLAWMLTREEHLKGLSNNIKSALIEKCGSTKIKEKIEELYLS